MSDDVTSSYKAAAVSASAVFLDREATTEKACSLIREAAANGARLIAFPETFIPGYPYWFWFRSPTQTMPLFKEMLENAVEIDSDCVRSIGAAAKEADACVVMGINERDGGTLYNSQLFFDRNGELLGHRRKLHPTNVERTLWGMGDGSGLKVYDTDFGKLGGLICFEHTMDAVKFAQTSQGRQVHVGCWPGGAAIIHNPRSAFWSSMAENLQRSLALTGQTFVISAASPVNQDVLDRLGLEDGNPDLKLGGGWTAIIDPWGRIIGGPLEDREGIVYADIDLSEIDGVKYLCDSTGYYARPDVVRVQVNMTSWNKIEPMPDD